MLESAKKKKSKNDDNDFDIPEFPIGDREPNKKKRYLQPVFDQSANDILIHHEGTISKLDRLRK